MCCCGAWCPGGVERPGLERSTPEAECQWWVDRLVDERGSAERLQGTPGFNASQGFSCLRHKFPRFFLPEGTTQWRGFFTKGAHGKG